MEEGTKLGESVGKSCLIYFLNPTISRRDKISRYQPIQQRLRCRMHSSQVALIRRFSWYSVFLLQVALSQGTSLTGAPAKCAPRYWAIVVSAGDNLFRNAVVAKPLWSSIKRQVWNIRFSDKAGSSESAPHIHPPE